MYLNEPDALAIIRDTFVHLPAQIGDSSGRNSLSTAYPVA
jgi:hypothetical protein